jgi:hypothetical protein
MNMCEDLGLCTEIAVTASPACRVCDSMVKKVQVRSLTRHGRPPLAMSLLQR